MKTWLSICFLFVSTASPPAVPSELFGKEPSPKEKEAFDYTMMRTSQALKGLGALSSMMEYQAFAEGRCGGYLVLEAKAKAGDAGSEYMLGDLYHKGTCVPKNDASSFKWITAAAESGYEGAYYDLGFYLLNGIGTPVDKKSAAHWFELATKTDTRAFVQLAFIFLNGEGVPQNFSKALEYANAGANSGESVAQLVVANFLVDESFGNPDLQAAYRWALLAKANGNPTAAAGAQELIQKIAPQLSPKQIRDAQSAASKWKPHSLEQTADPTVFSLPAIGPIADLSMTEQQARSALDKLGLPRDRLIFFKAIEKDNLDIVRLYVMAGASVDSLSPFYMELPIHHAARNGSKNVLEYLINRGADVNASANKDGDTPILMAMSAGHREVVDILLNHRARVDHTGIVYNAVKFNDPALLQRLKDAGAKIDINYVGTPLANAVAATQGDDLQTKHCLERSVGYLLENGANANAKDDSNTVLTSAIGAKNPMACVRLLLEHGADPNGASPTHQSPLFLATLFGNADVASLLLERGANAEEVFHLGPDQIPMIVENKDARAALMNGGSLLLLAVAEEHASIANLLRSHGANPTKADQAGESPLSLAKKRRDSVMTSVLNNESASRKAQ